jgi:hypothetical protein
MKLPKRDQRPPTRPHSSRKASSVNTTYPKRKCHTMALPPILALSTEPAIVSASTQ